MDDSALAFAAGQLMYDDRVHSKLTKYDAGVDALINDQSDQLSGIFRRVTPEFDRQRIKSDLTALRRGYAQCHLRDTCHTLAFPQSEHVDRPPSSGPA